VISTLYSPTFLNARMMILRCEEEAFLCQNEMRAWYHCCGQRI